MAGPRTRAGVSWYLQMADDVAALLATLGLDRPVVGGYSDGGLVTLELGARHPGVAGALLVGAAYPHVDGALWSSPAPSGGRRHGRTRRGARRGELRRPGRRRQVVAPGRQGAMAGDRAADGLDVGRLRGLDRRGIRAIDVPVLVFAGGRDEEMGRLDLMGRSSGSWPTASSAVCARADHVGPLTRGGMFAALIGDFSRRSRRP